MQRTGPIGGPGHIGLQGPPRSLKISPIKVQDEPVDPISQSKLDRLINQFITSVTGHLIVHEGTFGDW